jgi:Phytanoyl-CoA dioxygenase (PhyH)
MAATTRSILGADQIEAYHRDGYVVPRYQLPGDLLTKLQALTLKLVEDNPGLTNQHMVGPHVPGSGTQNLKSGPGWMDIATHSDILDMIEQIIGPDIVLWGSGIFYKRPLAGPATPWHRDSVYTPIRPLATTTVWIAVFDSVVANGCLRVIPGSHQTKEIGEHVLHGRDDLFLPAGLASSDVDESAAVDVELKAGQMLVFDMFTTHGARTNLGTQYRAGYALRFMPATSQYDHDSAVHTEQKGYGHDTRPLILVRGIDRCGRNDFQRGHPRHAAGGVRETVPGDDGWAALLSDRPS